ncbi:MAG: hypothetical protein AB1497_03550 [Bacillota bacterium]
MKTEQAMKKVLRLKALICLIAFPMLFRLLPPAQASASSRVFIVVVPYLEWEDLGSGAFGDMIDSSALGLMVTNTAGKRGDLSGYVTVGAGSRALGPGAGDARDSSDDGARALYTLQTGIGVDSSEWQVVHLGLAQMVSENSRVHHMVRPGLMGEVLSRHGITTAVFGNADLEGERQRAASTIVMDAHGRVKKGMVGQRLLLWDEAWPFGRKSNYPLLLELALSVEAPALIAVETGDLYRAEEYELYMLPEAGAVARQHALWEVGNFIQELAASLAPGDELFLLVPVAGRNSRTAGSTLVPFMAYGGRFKEGVLTSPSTRRRGIVLNTDVAATVLSRFGLEAAEIYGRPMEVLASENSWSEVSRERQRILVNHGIRSVLLKAYILASVIVLSAGAYSLYFKRRWLNRLGPTLVSLALVPLFMLVAGALRIGSPAAALAMSFGMAVLVAWATSLVVRGRWVECFFVVGGLTQTVLILQVLSGGHLLGDTPLGYSTIGAARFYGIGNEYMGVLLGGTIVAVSTARDLFGRWGPVRWLTAAQMAMTVLVTGMPGLGANFGGGLSAAIAWGYLETRHAKKRIGIHAALALCAALGLSVAVLMVLLDFYEGTQTMSHIGGSMITLFLKGPAVALQTIARKIDMNIRLIRYTLWTRALLTAVGSYALLVHRPAGIYRAVAAKYHYTASGLAGVAVAAFASFVLNDSGVVAAATTMIIGSAAAITLSLKEWEEQAVS